MTAQEIVTQAPAYIQIALAVVGTASAVAAVTPTPKDDGVLMIVRKLLDLLACNFGKAANK